MSRQPARRLSTARTIGLLILTLFAFAALDQFADELMPAAPPAMHSFAVPAGLVGDEWTGGPRECEPLKGITTACVFMD